MADKRDVDASRSITSSLLRTARAGDSFAWERLFELFHPFVYRWMRRWGVPESEAPDLVQNTFTNVYKSIERFDHESENTSFRGWLWRISRNVANAYFSSQRYIQLDSQLALTIADSPDDEDDGPECIVLLHRVLEVISRDFHVKTIELFRKSVLEGRETSELALEYGMKKSANRKSVV